MITFDVSRFPLVVATTELEFTADDAVVFEDTLEALYERQRRFVFVSISRELKMPHTRISRRLAQWMRASRERRQRWVIGTAIHVESPTISKLVSFFNMLAPSPCPQEVFDTREQAIVWAKDMLEADIPLFESRTGS